MCRLLAYRHIDHSNDEYDDKQDNCRRTSQTLGVRAERVVDISDDSVEGRAHRSGGTHLLAEDTDDARILLEATDEGGDYDVCNHGGEERNGNSCEGSESSQ